MGRCSLAAQHWRDVWLFCEDQIADGAEQCSVALRLPALLRQAPIVGTITLSGYEGSELLVARLLIESGADVPYVGTACASTAMESADDAAWLEAHGC